MKELTTAEIERLRDKYYSTTNKQLALELGITEPTLMKLINKYCIPAKGKGYGMRKEIKVM